MSVGVNVNVCECEYDSLSQDRFFLLDGVVSSSSQDLPVAYAAVSPVPRDAIVLPQPDIHIFSVLQQRHHTAVGVTCTLLSPVNSLFHVRGQTTETAFLPFTGQSCGTVFQSISVC